MNLSIFAKLGINLVFYDRRFLSIFQIVDFTCFTSVLLIFPIYFYYSVVYKIVKKIKNEIND